MLTIDIMLENWKKTFDRKIRGLDLFFHWSFSKENYGFYFITNSTRKIKNTLQNWGIETVSSSRVKAHFSEWKMLLQIQFARIWCFWISTMSTFSQISIRFAISNKRFPISNNRFPIHGWFLCQVLQKYVELLVTLEISANSPCLWASFHPLTPLLVVFLMLGNLMESQYEMLKLSTKRWIPAFNAQGSRGIIVEMYR
jgi:hypothetical protein